jgi:ABC-2 type transport system ATP-binding protein
MSAEAVLRASLWTGIVLAAIAAAPAVEAPMTQSAAGSTGAGALVGVLLFATLARRRLPMGSLTRVPRVRLAARSLVLALKSASEEAFWRAFLLGVLLTPFGRIGALTLTTGLFALAHASSQGRRAWIHLLTGTAFGTTYLATGRLEAAVAAHASYNVLVGAASLASAAPLSVSATSATSEELIRSPAPTGAARMEESGRLPRREQPVAALKAVDKSFGNVRALAGVTFELRPGELLGLLGPNGAGKSTAVALMLGLRRPDAGRAVLFGRDPRDPAARRDVGVVLQDVSFPPGLRVREVLDLVSAHFAQPVPRDELLARLHLDDLVDRQAGGLSGGQQRRLAVALALAGRPHALFLDEPTAGLDASSRRSFWQELNRFVELGGAVLLTTQRLEEAERAATRLVVLQHGSVLLEGTVDDLRARAGLTRVSLRSERLPALANAIPVESQRDRHVFYVDDADAFVARLVHAGVRFSELEVVRMSLEDAFLTLTGDDW